jgi:hypothetical protein
LDFRLEKRSAKRGFFDPTYRAEGLIAATGADELSGDI